MCLGNMNSRQKEEMRLGTWLSKEQAKKEDFNSCPLVTICIFIYLHDFHVIEIHYNRARESKNQSGKERKASDIIPDDVQPCTEWDRNLWLSHQLPLSSNTLEGIPEPRAGQPASPQTWLRVPLGEVEGVSTVCQGVRRPMRNSGQKRFDKCMQHLPRRQHCDCDMPTAGSRPGPN